MWPPIRYAGYIRSKSRGRARGTLPMPAETAGTRERTKRRSLRRPGSQERWEVLTLSQRHSSRCSSVGTVLPTLQRGETGLARTPPSDAGASVLPSRRWSIGTSRTSSVSRPRRLGGHWQCFAGPLFLPIPFSLPTSAFPPSPPLRRAGPLPTSTTRALTVNRREEECTSTLPRPMPATNHYSRSDTIPMTPSPTPSLLPTSDFLPFASFGVFRGHPLPVRLSSFRVLWRVSRAPSSRPTSDFRRPRSRLRRRFGGQAHFPLPASASAAQSHISLNVAMSALGRSLSSLWMGAKVARIFW